MRIFLTFLLLFYDVNGSSVSVNSNRGFLFGDVLEPLCSVDVSGENLSNLEVIELFHKWEKFTSSQLTSNSIEEYRKAMPCFPGPPLTTSSDHLIPPYPDCDTFVNISETTIGEVEDILGEMRKNGGQDQMDVSLRTIINSLSNRLQNLIDYLPEGETKRKTETQLSTLVNLRNSPPNYSNPPKFNPSNLLNCFNITSLPNLISLTSKPIGAIACSQFQICSYSDLSSNPCLSSLNITENQYNSVISKTIGELMKGKISGIGQFFGQLIRSKRTPEYEEVTMKMDGREEEEVEEEVEEWNPQNSEDMDPRIEDNGQENSMDPEEGSGTDHIPDSDDVTSQTEGSGDAKFLEALSYFKSQEIPDILNSTWNSSMIESLLPSDSMNPSIKNILSEFKNQEFKISDFLKKLNFSDLSSLKSLLASIGINVDTLLNSDSTSSESGNPDLQNILKSNETSSMLLGILKQNPDVLKNF